MFTPCNVYPLQNSLVYVFLLFDRIRFFFLIHLLREQVFCNVLPVATLDDSGKYQNQLTNKEKTEMALYIQDILHCLTLALLARHLQAFRCGHTLVKPPARPAEGPF